MNKNKALDELLQQPSIWRAGDRQRHSDERHIGSGYSELDNALPGGGWPIGALSEILHEHNGIGELRLVMPALSRLSRQGRWIAFIAPPFIPYAPSLAGCGIDLSRVLLVHPRTAKEGLWALEQALRTGTCGAVLAWPRHIDEQSLRRLQLAAETGGALGLLFRDEQAAAQASPAALRLCVDHTYGQIKVHLLKCRGGRSGGTVTLQLNDPATHHNVPRTPAKAPSKPQPNHPWPMSSVQRPRRPAMPPRGTTRPASRN
ncbi:hypothetical protein CAI21_09210 [Alkalilimnicola ehrlichii]|uniref:translesion DNA synthesis-associated protein ImuA n=1 Tax=Alkalilimnicola ehrlichii TaxID=351052 RepID=UPI000E2F9B2D|nr:translesion DNA synthesis-associated protein ImuA [Alkalilimnicola ehrlichii]RFA29980.1 hypothetical protein CAI21_09210 [Alkalilimnicola ehrlichii]